jgi:hypothetical protein
MGVFLDKHLSNKKKKKPRARIGCMPGCERITLKERCDKHGQAQDCAPKDQAVWHPHRPAHCILALRKGR